MPVSPAIEVRAPLALIDSASTTYLIGGAWDDEVRAPIGVHIIAEAARGAPQYSEPSRPAELLLRAPDAEIRWLAAVQFDDDPDDELLVLIEPRAPLVAPPRSELVLVDFPSGQARTLVALDTGEAGSGGHDALVVPLANGQAGALVRTSRFGPSYLMTPAWAASHDEVCTTLACVPTVQVGPHEHHQLVWALVATATANEYELFAPVALEEVDHFTSRWGVAAHRCRLDGAHLRCDEGRVAADLDTTVLDETPGVGGWHRDHGVVVVHNGAESLRLIGATPEAVSHDADVLMFERLPIRMYEDPGGRLEIRYLQRDRGGPLETVALHLEDGGLVHDATTTLIDAAGLAEPIATRDAGAVLRYEREGSNGRRIGRLSILRW